MTVWLLVLGFMMLAVAAMAVGVLAGRKPLAGSCGGLSALGLKESCEVCGGQDEVCEEESRKRQISARRRSDESRGADLGYNATRR